MFILSQVNVLSKQSITRKYTLLSVLQYLLDQIQWRHRKFLRSIKWKLEAEIRRRLR